MNDLVEWQKHLLAEFDKIKEEDLAKEMDWLLGKQAVSSYLMFYVSEIHHYEGQIAAICGVENRKKGV